MKNYHVYALVNMLVYNFSMKTELNKLKYCLCKKNKIMKIMLIKTQDFVQSKIKLRHSNKVQRIIYFVLLKTHVFMLLQVVYA